MLSEHDVVVASSGREGKEVLSRDADFDVILCYLLMADLFGMDLVAWLATHDSSLVERVVFITGGAFTPKAGEYLTKVSNIRIEKPFDMTNLKKIVGELIMAHRLKNELGEPKV